MSLRQIAGRLGRAQSTISRELRRNTAGGVAAGWQKNRGSSCAALSVMVEKWVICRLLARCA
jgi:IS30 family transposase